MSSRRLPSRLLRVLSLTLAGAIAGCGESHTATPTPTAPSILVFSPQNNDLDVYAPLDGNRKQVVVSGNESGTNPNLLALNGQVCFDPSGSRQFIMGQDAGQPDPPAGWGILQLEGTDVGKLSVKRIAQLTPTYQEAPDNYGCGYLHDGRILTADIGNNHAGPGNGQLIVWFPPFGLANNRYCKIDITLGTAGGIFVDKSERIYVASARAHPGIYRYTGPFPTSDTAAGGCGRLDPLGSPMADVVRKEKFILPDTNTLTPNAVVGSDHDTFYVSSVSTGMIAEYDADGTFVRRILEPPAGEHLGTTPFSTGSPLGLAVDSYGTLYYADLGLAQGSDGIGPVDGFGSLRRIRFENGTALPPETLDSGLNFPDGLGVLEE